MSAAHVITRQGAPELGSPELVALFASTRTENGRSLLQLVDQSPLLLIFLRHFGCSFCRQSIEDVSLIREELRRRKIEPVFVHMGSPERAKPYFDYYHLGDVERVSNPDQSLYRDPVFQLPRVPLWQLFRPAVWKAWVSGTLRRHGIGTVQEDGFQMPGVFFLRDRAIANTFRYRTIADRPDYLALVK